MKLFVDIGNTRAKWIVLDGSEVVQRGAINNTDFTELSLAVDAPISTAWASCVAQHAMFERFADIVEQQYAISLNRAAVQPQVGDLTNGYRALDRLGVDRWLAALGGRQITKAGDLVVVDAGTAVTIDFVSSQNCFEGGVILPGANLMNDALVGRTAGIVSEPVQVTSVVGQTTQECVNAGSFYGLAGAIERVVDEMRKRVPSQHRDGKKVPFSVLMCGGDAPRLAALLPDSYLLQPDLVFVGLRVLELNQQRGASDDSMAASKASLL